MNENYLFKTGDVVKLKSGGVQMTVESCDIKPISETKCVWYETGKINRENFYGESLELVDRSTKTVF